MILDVIKGRSGDWWKINEIKENPDWVERNSSLVRKILPSEMEAINSSIHNNDNYLLRLEKPLSVAVAMYWWLSY
jgi:hypothetical protein